MNWPFVSRWRLDHAHEMKRVASKRVGLALDALEQEGEDGINKARSYLYNVLFILK